ncbi:MAG TPA: hypothetical protein VMT11_13395 [Myxococcaceae bacterium]|nr:hypothetical protein [Myxococcaceae bacterium]
MGEAEPRVTGPEREPGRWGRLYALVLGALALEIIGLWVLERVFR